MRTVETTRLLARLELGFRMDSAHLKELEKDLTMTLQCARRFRGKPDAPGNWSATWLAHWDDIEEILSRIRVLLKRVDGSIESPDKNRLKQALGAWEALQSEVAQLAVALRVIRTQEIGLNAADRTAWTLLIHALESHLKTLRACAWAKGITLELLKAAPHGEEEDPLVQDILSKPPGRTLAGARVDDTLDQAYRKAAIDLEREQHEFMGFMDGVKGLLLWVETTEERARKNLSLQVDQA